MHRPRSLFATLTALVLVLATVLSACSQTSGVAPTFSLQVAGGAVSLAPGSSTSIAVQLTPEQGFKGTVVLSLVDSKGNLASGFSVVPSSLSITNGQAELTAVALSVGAGVSVGDYVMRMEATGSGVSVSAPLDVNVVATPTPDFTIAASPSALSTTIGGSVTTTVAITPENGFSGAVTLTLLDGLGNPATGVALSPATIQVAAGQTVVQPVMVDVTGLSSGSHDLTLSASSGSLTHVAPLTLTIAGGLFLARTDYPVGSNPHAVTVADVNGDGKLDLVTANYGGGDVSVLLGNGDGTFQAQQAFAVGSQPASVIAADVNGDGKLDLVTANFGSTGSTGVSVLLGNGDGTFQAQQTFAAGNNPRSVTAADVNADGILDLVVGDYGNTTSAGVSVLIGNGDGTFQPPTTYSTAGTHIYSAVSADVNDDGRLDLVASGFDSAGLGIVAMWLGDGIGTFQDASPGLDTGNNSHAVLAVDVNGDGTLDLVTANDNVTGTLSVLLGVGYGAFAPASPYATGSSPVSLAAADLNSDGKVDLVTANDTLSGSVSVLLGH